MATALLTPYTYPNGSDHTQRRQRVFGLAALSGNYATGGIAVSFLGMKTTAGGSFLLDSPSAKPASAPQFYSIAGSGYVYQYVTATAKLKIFEVGAAGTLTEYPNATAVPADTVEFAAEFARSY